MKHILPIFFLAITLSSIANAQECKVPISVQLGKYSTNTRNNRHDEVGASFMRFLENRGFSTEVANTRIAIQLLTKTSVELCMGEDHRMDVEISFIDAFTGKSFYTTELDRHYCGSFSETNHELAGDFNSSLPELDSLAEAIRLSIIDAFEINARHMAEIGVKYAKQGDHDVALYALVQYPSCCRSYPKIRDVMVVIFRDYMKKNHKVLLDVAKSVWRNEKSDTDARFVVSLLNSVKFTEKEQKKADRLFKKIAKEYPSLDLKATDDYTFVPELKAIAINEARSIGIEFSTDSEDIFPEMDPFIPSSYRPRYYKPYYNNDYDPYYDNDITDEDWFPVVMTDFIYL